MTTPPPDSLIKRRTLRALLAGGWHYYLILLFTLGFHYPLLLPGMGMPHWGDFYCFHTPMRIATAQALHSGHMPFMTQAIFGGYPLYQDPQFAFFYPVNFLFALFVPNPNAEAPLDAYILINLLLLSAAALYFMRSLGFARVAALAGALVASMNGFVQMHITHINILQVMATGYLAAGLLARLAWSGGRQWRYALGAGLALAAGNLAGHPQTTLFLHYSLGIGMLVLAMRNWQRTADARGSVRMLALSLLAVIIGVAIAAIQLLPTAHLLSICTRVNMSRDEAMGEAMRLKHLPTLLFPGFYMPLRWWASWPIYKPVNMYWIAANPLEGLSFFGVTACALGLVGFLSRWRSWQVLLTFATAAFLLGAAMGEQLPFYGWLYDYAPLFKVIRVPSRLLWVFYTAWGMLAAVGVRCIIVRQAAQAARMVTWLVLGSLWLALLLTLGTWRSSWSEAFIQMFVQNHVMFDQGVRENLDKFMEAIRDQAVVGVFYLVVLLGWLWLVRRQKAPRATAAAITAITALELFTYGFCKSYVIDIKPVGYVQSRVYSTFEQPPIGRASVPDFVHGGGAINTAIINGINIANGYSVTYPDWVKAFKPTDTPPWRNGIDEILFDIWNVSDITVRKRFVKAKLGPYNIDVDDWGWQNIGTAWQPGDDETSMSTRAKMLPQFVINTTDVTTSATALYILCTAEKAQHLRNGTPMAEVTATAVSGEVTSVTLRLGEHLADGRYGQALDRHEKPAHKDPPRAYTRHALWEDTDNMGMYFAPMALNTTAPLVSISIKALAPWPASVGISQVIIALADNSIALKYPQEISSFTDAPSGAGEYRRLHRDDAPGYAWMVPTAVRGSYKATGNIMARMYDGTFDPRQKIIVDKREYPPDEAARVDSTRPNDFRGTASLQWQDPGHGTIHASSNDQGWLVISLTWDKGWTAIVDGKQVPLARANGPHSALPLPAGRHTVELSYQPVHWWPGLIITTLTLLATLAALMFPSRVQKLIPRRFSRTHKLKPAIHRATSE